MSFSAEKNFPRGKKTPEKKVKTTFDLIGPKKSESLTKKRIRCYCFSEENHGIQAEQALDFRMKQREIPIPWVSQGMRFSSDARIHRPKFNSKFG